jgi:hypothetical protein
MAEETAAAACLPPNVAADLARIFEALDVVIPTRREQNLLVATWNLRASRWACLGRAGYCQIMQKGPTTLTGCPVRY